MLVFRVFRIETTWLTETPQSRCEIMAENGITLQNTSCHGAELHPTVT